MSHAGRPHPVPGHAPASPRPAEESAEVAAPDGDPFAGLTERPVSDHVAVYEAEHARLQRELSTIDEL